MVPFVLWQQYVCMYGTSVNLISEMYSLSTWSNKKFVGLNMSWKLPQLDWFAISFIQMIVQMCLLKRTFGVYNWNGQSCTLSPCKQNKYPDSLVINLSNGHVNVYVSKWILAQSHCSTAVISHSQSHMWPHGHICYFPVIISNMSACSSVFLLFTFLCQSVTLCQKMLPTVLLIHASNSAESESLCSNNNGEKSL